MNRFKGLDSVDRVPEELWVEVHNITQEAVIKTIPTVGVGWGGEMQNGCLRRPY